MRAILVMRGQMRSPVWLIFQARTSGADNTLRDSLRPQYWLYDQFLPLVAKLKLGKISDVSRSGAHLRVDGPPRTKDLVMRYNPDLTC